VSTPAGTRPDPGLLARMFEDDQHAWTRTRQARRRSVLAEAVLLAALLALVLWTAGTTTGWTTGFAVAWCVGMLAFVPLHSMLNLGIRGVYDRRVSSLDEHQQRLRVEAAAAAGVASGALTLAAWTVGIAVVSVTGHTAPALCAAFLLWGAACLMPYWRLAWTMPDEPDPLA